jgi:hypothetical protein
MPARRGLDIAPELGGRYLLRYLIRKQYRHFTTGSISLQFVTPTPYSPIEVISWLAAVTNLDDGDELTVMAGAEERSDGDSAGRPRFRRFNVGSIRLNGDSPNLWPTGDIKNLLAQAVRMAVDIQPVQLEAMELLAS